ncbi:MAG: hydroxyisourate hydrolase [Nocardioidaceae bacterium]
MSAVTTHVLDTSLGCPAAHVDVTLEPGQGPGQPLASARTDDDGRVQQLGPDRLAPGVYRLRFATAGYFARLGTPAFYPEVVISFEITDPAQHYHVPLLLSPFGYSTYRGS